MDSLEELQEEIGQVFDLAGLTGWQCLLLYLLVCQRKQQHEIAEIAGTSRQAVNITLGRALLKVKNAWYMRKFDCENRKWLGKIINIL